MDLKVDPADQLFRQEVRQFVREHLPQDVRHKTHRFEQLKKDDIGRWHKILHAHGWGAPAWPRQFGGTGWSAAQRAIFEEECAVAGAPRYYPHLNMIGPVLQRFGTPAQHQRFLPPLLAMDEWWCQGYSEPGAGSDLAGLQTRAQREGDVYVVNGQKIWTSFAQWADWMFCLVRTSREGKPQEGISFLLIDMKSPGLSVRPIVGIGGEGDLNAVFFDNVRVPVHQLVHEENAGWTVAKYLLGFERTGLAGLGTCRFMLQRLKDIALEQLDDSGSPLIHDPLLAARIASLEIEVRAHDWSLRSALAAEAPSDATSLLKLRGTQIQQEIASLLFDCAGVQAGPFDVAGLHGALPSTEQLMANNLTSLYFDWRKATIYGGTTEIQKNIVAKQVLGM